MCKRVSSAHPKRVAISRWGSHHHANHFVDTHLTRTISSFNFFVFFSQFASMAKFADVAYKSVTAGLGLATLWVGGNLVFNITHGISWHYAQDKAVGEGEARQKN